MSKWLPGLDSLHRQLAHELEPLGKLTLSQPCATLRKITIQHSTGATLRVLVGVEIPISLRTYFISVLRLVDTTNQKLTYVQNQTFRRNSSVVPELGLIVECVRRSLDQAIEKEALPARGAP